MSLKHTKPAKQKSVTHINAYTNWSTSKFQLTSGFITRYLEEILYDRHIILINFFPHGATVPSGPGPPHYRDFTITRRHTTLGRTPLDELSARYRELYLITHITHKRQMYMHPVRFEPTIPASERAQTHRLRRRGHMDRNYSKLLTIIPHPVLTFLYSISHSLATATH